MEMQQQYVPTYVAVSSASLVILLCWLQENLHRSSLKSPQYFFPFLTKFGFFAIDFNKGFQNQNEQKSIQWEPSSYIQTKK
jgi:hypothetical protein